MKFYEMSLFGEVDTAKVFFFFFVCIIFGLLGVLDVGLHIASFRNLTFHDTTVFRKLPNMTKRESPVVI